MRRYIAIALAILLLMGATRTLVAQDTEQSATDRLLEILKDRRIISEDEYGELKGLADTMTEEDAALDRRLGDLDRSIADYLAKEGDEGARAYLSYNKGQGFRFYTSDGLFQLNIGGLFLFTYTALDSERESSGYHYEKAKSCSSSSYGHFGPGFIWGNDRNSFDVQYLGLVFRGHAFAKALTYYIELFLAPSLSPSDSSSGSNGKTQFFDTYTNPPRRQEGVQLLDGWVNYNCCDVFQVRLGQMKLPTGRQALVHQRGLAFPMRNVASNLFTLKRDVGIKIHDTREVENSDFAYDYSFGIANGEGKDSSANDNNQVAWSGRITVFPMGYVPYVEGAWTEDDKLRCGLGFWMGQHKAHAQQPSQFGERIQNTLYTWGLDAVLVWDRFFLTGEFMKRKVSTERRGITSPTGHYKNRGKGWFAQAGYMIIPKELEIIGRYGVNHLDRTVDDVSGLGTPNYLDKIVEYAIGLAYYFDGHDLKVTLDAGQTRVNWRQSDDLEFCFVRLALWLGW